MALSAKKMSATLNAPLEKRKGGAKILFRCGDAQKSEATKKKFRGGKEKGN